MNPPQLERYEEKLFYTLLIDAIGLASEACRHPDRLAQQMLSRACILTSAMLIECCANICVESRGLKHRGTPVEKLSAYANSLRRMLDVQRSEVLAIEELRAVRNGYVHTVVKDHPAGNPAEDRDSWGEVHPGTTSVLRVSKSPSLWSATDAVSVLRAVERFLRYLFIDVLEVRSSGDVFALLATRVYVKGGASGNIAESLLDNAVLFAEHELEIDFRFLGSQSAASQETPPK